MSACIPVCLYICLSIYLSVSIFVSVCVCLCFFCLSDFFSLSQCACVAVCLYIWLPVSYSTECSIATVLSHWLPLRLPLFLSRFFTLCDCLCIWIFNACFRFKSNKYAPLRIYLVKDLICSSPLYAKHPKHPHFGSTGVNMIVEAVSYFLTSSCLLSLVMLWHKLDWNNLLQSVEIHGLEVSL